MPKVTVALLTYNRIKYLKEAIEGVLRQTYSDFELIIMDNGSTQETYELIKPFLNDKVKYHRNAINDRSFINYPFDIATGEYLIIIHDDDIMMSSLIEKQVAILDQNSDVSIVAANTQFIDENSISFKTKGQTIKADICWGKTEFIKDSIIKGIYLPCPTVMFRRQVFDTHNLRFNLSVGPATDLYLWYETNLLDYKIYFLSEPLYKYRIHNSQDSTVSQIEMQFSIYFHLLDLLKKNNLYKLIPHAKRQRLKLIFDSIVNSFYHNNIKHGELKLYFSKLFSLGFQPSILSFRSVAKLVIGLIKL
jgi:glycosyltransferase involved in cell wall biosynthesis